ncbi:hypothetical protein [Bacillus safensis]|uniref:hypothetical protein n=1 Tax=Bacillus TaxID=1386 RepID=UPI0007655B78|nr:hypothetical protein [Bacillus safensis]MBG9821748.1 hypothetical protein [Bacillus safensis]GMG79553.1 hypothetical protein ShirakiTA10_25150 [Bacillus safensis]CVM30641.1 Uncharacterised protein [Streptococcus pneumoniae]
MKILVLKTESRLEKEAKEILREEARKAAQTGIMILDGGMSLEVIEIDKSYPLDGLNPGVPIYDETVETL